MSLRPASLALVVATLVLACGDAPAPSPDSQTADAEDILDASPDTDDTSEPDAVDPDATTAPDGDPDVTADDGPDVPPPEPRAIGERAPRTAACDAVDPTLCLLPWPSNVFTALDPATDTGVRLAVDGASLPEDDPLTRLSRADGFSRVSPIVTGFADRLDAASLDGPDGPPVRLLVAEGDRLGQVEPVHCQTFEDDDPPHATALVCFPHRPLAPATEHLVVVLRDLQTADQTPIAAEPLAQVALGLVPPADPAEAALHAYHAPARAALTAAGVAFGDVARLWDFTTRSAEDPRRDLRAVRDAHVAAVDAGAYEVAIDSVQTSWNPDIALVVRGRLTGLPSFVEPDGALARDDAGHPTPIGVHDAPFRAMIPAGEGDYRLVMYAHGTGGDVGDGSFDGLMAEFGAMKLGLEIDGWTGATLPDTLTRLATPIWGSDAVAARVVESLAGGAAVQRALDGALGDALAAETLGDQPNPAAGRRPDTTTPVWAGGSLGGTMGLVYGHLEPSILGGVLNVPGAAVTHWLPASNFYWLLEGLLSDRLQGPVETQLVVAMAQTLFDAMDGANWAGGSPTDPVFLVQISVGDPVLPNVGSDMVATALDALHVGAPLYPLVGLEPADQALGRSAVTQFQVAGTSELDVHGFAAKDTVAGQAAQQQFIDFVTSLWDGAPRIDIPQACQANTPAGSCDFSAAGP